MTGLSRNTKDKGKTNKCERVEGSLGHQVCSRQSLNKVSCAVRAPQPGPAQHTDSPLTPGLCFHKRLGYGPELRMLTGSCLQLTHIFAMMIIFCQVCQAFCYSEN